VLLRVVLLLTLVSSVRGNIAEALEKISNINEIRSRAADYILSLQKDDSGWGYDTPRVLTSLLLVQPHYSDLNINLAIKQQDIELLVELLKNDSSSPIRSGRLAMFVYGLLAECRDPRNFYDIDLITKLKSIPTYNAFELGYVSQALCIAGEDIETFRIDEMKSYLHNLTVSEVYARDYIAMLLQALNCISQKSAANLDKIITKTTKQLKSVQNKDGSFGNVDTTAVVVQAIMQSSDDNWNVTAAVDYFIKQQTEEGLIGNKAATVQILPILYAKNYMNITDIKCDRKEVTTTRIPETGAAEISITYSLWIGNDASKKYTINLTIQGNLSFYEIMKLAAKQDPRFQFVAADSSYGHYVTSIGGIEQDLSTKYYWMLAVLDDSNTPIFLDRGIDTFYPKDGDNVVFWYKSF